MKPSELSRVFGRWFELNQWAHSGTNRNGWASLNCTCFTDKAFDLILASLVMHYLPDWSRPLPEFNRLLPKGGRLVLSTHHPFMDHASTGRDNYFETYSFDEIWQRGGKDIAMRFWHRPLHAMFDALKSAGFQIDMVNEPQPDPEARTLFPQAYQSLTTKPRFLFFSVVKA
ncbi:class I SAM-dependent methyltransferase [Rhizobium ruizarguesonis]|uniref:class I SAM-dependent methyltransferase n=1 Tax=Rhizobium ruizarguesonis TaxID=2081791 RepID=UPI001FE12407|nr:methyltransferase domain-containing protein [Rhizobium ruizarguesonis]